MPTQGLDNKISNIIGAKLPQWVMNQLVTRANKNTQDSRDNDNLLYLANKTAWVRLVSSINIVDREDLNYFKRIVGESISSESDLAKQFVLFGGTSKYLGQNSYAQRSGLGKDGAYGILGNEEIQKYGYKPMPGITSVNIETQGRLGSVRAATISFKCWDKSQLDIIDALYFKLGFTMFLEWGHTYFYPNPNNNKKLDPNKVQSTELYSIDPFEQGLNKEDILSRISQNSRDTDGNYDAMLGIVTNFNFTYSQDGGFDCTVRLMALGVLGDSIKINNPGVLPDILKEEIIKLNNTLIQLNALPPTTNNTGSQDLIDQFIGKDAKPKDLLQLISLDVVKEYATSGVTVKTYASLASTSPKIFESIAFDNNNNFSNIAKQDFRGILKNINSINRTDLVYTPSNFGYKISKTQTTVRTVKQDALNFFALEDKGFYDLDYKLPGDRYVLGKNATRGNVVLTDRVQYSDINLNLAYLKDRYLTNLKSKSSSGNDLLQKATLDFQNNKNVSSKIDGNGLNVLTLNLLNSTDFTSLGSNDYNRFAVTYTSPALNSVSTFDPYFVSITVDRDYRELDDRSRGSLTTSQAYSILNQVITKNVLEGGTFYNTTANGNLSFKELNVSRGIGTANNFLNPTVVKSINPNYSHYFFSVVYYVKLDDVGINLTLTSTEIDPATGLKKETKTTERRQLYAKVIVSFNDSSLIQNITAKNESVVLRDPDAARRNLQSQNQEQTTTAEDQALSQKALSTQIAQALNYQSSLEIILRTIQVHALNEAIGQFGSDIGRKVFVNNFYKDETIKGKKRFLEQIFSNGIFGSFIRDLVDNNIQDFAYTTDKKMDPIERFKIQSKYGFATNLMANKAAISELEGRAVNFKEILRAFVVPYQINQEIIKGTQTNHPVYIPLGLLLMILNHTCTIYDTKGDFQTPLVYIDFNPELNFFLTNTKQLSTNPWKTLIPFEGSFEDYKKLFDPKILGSDSILPVSGSTEKTPLFNPQNQDVLSGQLPKIKFGALENNTVYRGRMMNILLNVDYLVSLAQQYSAKDTINNVYLKPFLEQLLADLNKFLGNFNAFRLSYSDSANTFQLTDDQFIPSLSQEDQISAKQNKLDPDNRTEIPLIGKTSIAKSLEIKTEIASKLANMIAISANSTVSNKSTLSTNGSNYGYINTNYVDRYIIDRREPSGSNNGSRELDTMKISAAQFNQTISDFYSKINPSEATVSHATNYYIEKMSRIKNDEYPTRASAMIPVSLNFTTDGIAGMSMGQAFTISDELLPYTYSTKKVVGLPTDHVNNVGFVMVGLIHTIENNSWNTAVRANMIFLKDRTEFKSEITRVETRQGEFQINANNQFNTDPYQQTNFKAQSPEAKKAAENYLGKLITDTEWSQLVAATYAEASGNQTERAWVMAVILNRTRNSGKTITDTLTAKNQFQAVTGTSANGNRPSPMYVNGPDSSSAIAIYGAAVNILSQVPTNYIFFTSNNEAAYGAGTDISFLFNLRNKPGAKIIGKTVFSTTA